MDGILFVRTVETLLAVQVVKKMDFYEASGISTATMAQYRTGYAKNAGSRTVRRAANYFNMTPDDFADEITKSQTHLPTDCKRKERGAV